METTLCYSFDADYVVYGRWDGDHFIETTRWMIPGTWLED